MAASPLRADDPAALGPYRLTGRLGEGGQGVVYLGEDESGQRVAVKVLKTSDPAARTRFLREMEAARRVAPFCTAAVLDSSTRGDRPYVVSEYIDGPSLAQRVQDHGPLHGGALVRLAVNTASALAAIHSAGIVHRDLKPANVLLGPDGPRVVDFGIARAIDADTNTQMVGTPAYFAPEWIDGQPPTERSDVFAWAGTVVYAATGTPPFDSGPSFAALMNRIANAEPRLDGVPAALRPVIARCLAKDPARRPTARELIDLLVSPDGDARPSAGDARPPAGFAHPAPPTGAAPVPPPGPSFVPPPRPPSPPSTVEQERPRAWRHPGVLASVGAVAVAAALTMAFVAAVAWRAAGNEEDGASGARGASVTATDAYDSPPASPTDAYDSPPPSRNLIYESDFVHEATLPENRRRWMENEEIRYVPAGYRYGIAAESGSTVEAKHAPLADMLVTARGGFQGAAPGASEVGVTCRNDADASSTVGYGFMMSRDGRTEIDRYGTETTSLGSARVQPKDRADHELKALCKTVEGGVRLVFWVDGVKTLDVVDPDPLPAGVSGLTVETDGAAFAALFTRFSVHRA
ncbi:serine/threonine-protein kinase [Actinomadura rifamycini]|uniref:serine/threonine-protein kinase n=1 Tax=Actinomadura rifamycini TaxID=31962 RepID=UPI000412F501|nr:serine/threonine-protein kinase [Actinomadura rifamycini]